MIALLNRRDENEKEYMQYYRTALLTEMSDRENLIEVDSSMSEKEVDKVLKEVSGICITGYSDPEWIDEYLIAHAMENGKALFAICQGIQDMALYTRDDVEPVIGHQLLERKQEYVHWVNISRNSVLYNIVKEQRIQVNSCHNNMVLFNHSWDVVGVSDDGVVEAMENSEHLFQIGVQWHPEMLNDKYSELLFKDFVHVSRMLERRKR